MPRSIADIRKAAGGLENLTDEDILQATFQKYKAYYPSLDAYAAEVGYGGAGRGLTGSRISAGIDQYQANLLGLAERSLALLVLRVWVNLLTVAVRPTKLRQPMPLSEHETSAVLKIGGMSPASVAR